MIRKHKKYRRPKKPFDKKRIDEENVLIKKYGLKNKKEIWKAEAAISKIRNQAKELITSSREDQKNLFKKLNKAGFKTDEISDVLALSGEDLLKRRLQSIVKKKGLTRSPKQARQLIVHKRISISGRIVNKPSYIVKVDEEDKIKFVEKKKVKKPKQEKIEPEATTTPTESVEEVKPEEIKVEAK